MLNSINAIHPNEMIENDFYCFVGLLPDDDTVVTLYGLLENIERSMEFNEDLQEDEILYDYYVRLAVNSANTIINGGDTVGLLSSDGVDFIAYKTNDNQLNNWMDSISTNTDHAKLGIM